MKSRLLILFLAIFSFQVSHAQFRVDSVSTIPVNLFNPEDSLGITVFTLLDNYEKFGHFGAIESRLKSNEFIDKFHSLFDSTAVLPDDISDTLINQKEVTIDQYAQLGRDRGYQPYSLFIEKTDKVTAYRINNSENYFLTVRVMKLFDDKAFIGEEYKYAALYTMGIRFRLDTALAYITTIKMMDGAEKQNFLLGKYGRHIYSSILVTNNIESLIQPIPPPYVPQSVPTKSNFFISAGFQFINFLAPESYANNVGPFYRYSGTEQGVSISLKFQRAFGPKDVFGMFFGAEFERNTYGFTQNDIEFKYTDSPDGGGLKDKEGGKYDERTVQVPKYVEDGKLEYFKPEFGFFANLFPNKPVNIQLLGSFGNAFLVSKDYRARSIVSYYGEVYGEGGPISGDYLGFYTYKEFDFDGQLSEAQSFFFYKAGLAIDFMLGDRVALSLLGEYKSSFTYVIRENENNYPFFDPDSEEGFTSQLNSLSKSRLYDGFSVQAGIKIFLNEKR